FIALRPSNVVPMNVLLPETNKKAGVCYAFTRGGVELPVVDISHPAFALAVGTAEQRRMVEQFLKKGTPFASLPKLLRNLLLRFFLRGSVLARGIRESYHPRTCCRTITLSAEAFVGAYLHFLKSWKTSQRGEVNESIADLQFDVCDFVCDFSHCCASADCA